MAIPTQIIAVPYEDVRLEKPGYNEEYDRQICEKLGYPPEPVSNTRFEHNPNWRTDTLMGIQCAHDGAHLVWRVAWWVWWAAQFSLPLYMASIR